MFFLPRKIDAYNFEDISIKGLNLEVLFIQLSSAAISMHSYIMQIDQLYDYIINGCAFSIL